LLKEVFPKDKIASSDLLEIMQAMDLNRNGVIEFDEFVNMFKSARSATISFTHKKSTQRLPVYGNPIFVKLDDDVEKEETEVISIKSLLNKIEAHNFSFTEFAEVLQWNAEGEIDTNDFIKNMEEYFGSTLTSEELNILAQEIDRNKGRIEVKDLLQFLDTNVKNEDREQKLVNLDMLIMVLAFKKSNKKTATEFLKVFELTPTLKLSQTTLTNLLMDNFGYSKKSAGRLVSYFQEKSMNPNAIPVQVIINELEEYMQQTQVVPSIIEADDEEKVSLFINF
jgi:Ca2+-binding EF-hand superfamily protein